MRHVPSVRRCHLDATWVWGVLLETFLYSYNTSKWNIIALLLPHLGACKKRAACKKPDVSEMELSDYGNQFADSGAIGFDLTQWATCRREIHNDKTHAGGCHAFRRNARSYS